MKGLTSEQDNLSKSLDKGNEAVKRVSDSVKYFRENYEQIKNMSYLGQTIADSFDKVDASVKNTNKSVGRHLTETGEGLRRQREELEAAGKVWRTYRGEVESSGTKAAEALKKINSSSVTFDGKVAYEQWRNEIRKTIE